MKLLGSFIAAGALAISMLVAVPALSSAAPPYPASISTSCSYAQAGAVKRNRNFRVAFKIRTKGNARPRGYVQLRVYKIVTNRFRLNRVRSFGVGNKSLRRVSLGKFKRRGSYTTLMRFTPVKNSVYRSCSNGPRRFRVTR